ncbi:UDP-N-acetylmuramoyl-L-alanyl-D-glutamate--2,6-diaminopimelate ligase [Balneola sp. MJW-20]|uniref:UDP-N-acetylmuramoyl-L-alanyl-D-glutamate--2, 6-diaminopimelate ligase n=1 Tax=Gracilimonas aurantiaca TaxID=3234185 RepID=UPI0034665CB9
MNTAALIEICKPLHITNIDAVDEVTSFCIDSRKAKPGSAFLAISGTEVDGHMFIEDAIQNGANVIICEETFYTDDDQVCIMEVEESRKLAGLIAQAFYSEPAKEMKIIGITGTNGKTTTATLVYQVLKELGQKTSLLGTVNKRILDQAEDSALTTSDPIELAADMRRMASAGSDYLAMEVSSHALDQYRTAGVEFSVGAFTNLSHDHLDYHDSMEEYARAKKLLFDDLPSSSFAIINADDAYGAFMTGDCNAKIRELSFKDGSSEIKENTPGGLVLSIGERELRSPLVGDFNAYNVGMTFLICESLGFSPDEIAKALTKAPGAPGRMEKVMTEGEGPNVIVDYAHTPDALKNVLETLHEIREEDQKLFVVFGAGGDRDTSKRPEMAQIAEQIADRVIVTSDNPRTENPDLIIADIVNGFENLEKVKSISSRKEAIGFAISEAGDNDIVLIAGKGHETYQEVNGVRHNFDDRQVALEFLMQRSGEVN